MFDTVLAVVPPGPIARTTALYKPARNGLTSVEMSTVMSPPTGVGLPRSRVATGLAVTGAAISSVGAYLGGHLVAARKVASHDAAYDNTPLRP